MEGIGHMISRASNSAKALSKSGLTEYEQKSHRFSIYITGEKKLVNDKEVVAFRISSDGPYMPGGAQPLPEEYTSLSAFQACVSEALKAKAEAL